MELHQLRYLVAAARIGNFSRAAAHCHVSQPSLSQQIIKLEKELGEQLFHRSKRQVVLTDAGTSLLERATRILKEVEEAERDVDDRRGLLKGTVRIGILPTIAPHFLPRLLPTFSKLHPQLEIAIQEDTTARLLQSLTARELDLGIVSLPILDDRFVVEELFREELLLALPRQHALAKARQIRLTDLREERLILMKEGHCLSDQALSFCSKGSRQPQVVFRSAQLETVQALVYSGMGISLIPKMACRIGDPRYPIYRSIAPIAPQRSIVVATPKEGLIGRAAEKWLLTMRQAVS